MKAIWIKNNIVVDLSVWTKESTYPEEFEIIVVDDSVIIGPGYIYDGSSFKPQEVK